MPGSLALLLLEKSIERFERARSSKEAKYTVTQVAKIRGRGKGMGTEAGRELHSKLWGDPELIARERLVSTPLPLAWRFRFGWLYGVADQVLFREGVPVRVAEVKSYTSYRGYERAQASLYGLLVELNWGVRPRVELRGARIVEVKGWEEIALESLELFLKKIHY
ncbi:hypothetical protein IG193_02640 [Infirmifilum lucidum]|uniref:Uncharacterized protein n=1 Tax=Infirmifilum lucidum TaxID=2776706 RepID=A0A7L9FHS1_9CREN|nr:hypothetical protein [Infirmifilum lucidum]QOJ79378.1 hypothetical protein IG193_02640 [Infirmifilum lucidum]